MVPLIAHDSHVALRRDGEWHRNLNEELCLPMLQTMAAAWSNLFQSQLLSSLEDEAKNALESFLSEFEGSCSIDLRDRARQQGQVCLTEAEVALRKTVDVVETRIKDAQKSVSRRLGPIVRDQMDEGYQKANQEKGPGSVARRKVCNVL